MITEKAAMIIFMALLALAFIVLAVAVTQPKIIAMLLIGMGSLG